MYYFKPLYEVLNAELLTEYLYTEVLVLLLQYQRRLWVFGISRLLRAPHSSVSTHHLQRGRRPSPEPESVLATLTSITGVRPLFRRSEPGGLKEERHSEETTEETTEESDCDPLGEERAALTALTSH